jgi:hypothetical protein
MEATRVSPTTFERTPARERPKRLRAKLRVSGLATMLATRLAVLALACRPPSSASQLSPEPPSPPSVAAPSPSPSADELGQARGAIDAASAKPGQALLLQGHPLHPWCVSTLTTELNGDRIVQSIDWQGCTSSNRSPDPAYWEEGTLWYDEKQGGGRFGYSVFRTINDSTHILNTKLQTSGSFASSNYLAVRRGEMIDWNPTANPPRRTITTLTRLGEVLKAEEVDALVQAVTAK